jgi:hypothetical protein
VQGFELHLFVKYVYVTDVFLFQHSILVIDDGTATTGEYIYLIFMFLLNAQRVFRFHKDVILQFLILIVILSVSD